MSEVGASNNERLLAAARQDDEDMILEILEQADSFDINFADGLGNTALHYASSTPSPTVLEHILSHPKCDVDPQNRLERSTPLHLAVKIDDDDLRLHVVQSLLEAGANTKIQDKYKSIPIDLVPSRDNETRAAIRRAEADTFNINQDDIADDDDEPDSDEVPSDED